VEPGRFVTFTGDVDLVDGGQTVGRAPIVARLDQIDGRGKERYRQQRHAWANAGRRFQLHHVGDEREEEGSSLGLLSSSVVLTTLLGGEHGIHRNCCIPMHRRDDVAVGVKREGDGGMPEHL
jgi:hypothetical protein